MYTNKALWDKWKVLGKYKYKVTDNQSSDLEM